MQSMQVHKWAYRELYVHYNALYIIIDFNFLKSFIAVYEIF